MSVSKIVEEYMPYCAVRGHEEAYLKAIAEHLTRVGEVEVKHHYALCRIKGRKSNKTILILAQGTTPGYQAGEIKENGAVRMYPVDDAGCRTPLTWIEPFKPVDAETFSKRVTIYSDRKIDAVVPAPPVHYQYSVGKLAKADGMYAVSGYTKQQLEEMICPGDAITYTPYLQHLLNGRFFAPFLAYRIAPAAILCLAEKLIAHSPEYDTVLAVTGGSYFSGATRVTEQISPDELILLTFAAEESYKGDGVAEGVRINQFFGSAVNYPYSEKLEHYFTENGYRHSRLASLVNTNTPADECTYLGKGIPTAMFGVPVKYPNSSVSVVQESEVEYLVDALTHYLTHEEEA